MNNVLERLPLGARIAIIRLRSLGDSVLTTPAIALLKHARPDVRVGVVVEDRFAAVFAGNPDVERVLHIGRWRADLCINLHGGARSARLTVCSFARWRAGFAHFRFQPLYNVRIPTAQEILGVDRRVHTAEHLASAMFYLGVPPAEIPRARLFANAPSTAIPPYAVIHAMASAPDKTWPAEKFAALAAHLAERHQLEPVFIAGPGESLTAFQAFRCIENPTLEETKTLLAGATLFVGNDSGPAHMAAAFGLPLMVFFGASDVDVWRPWKTEAAVLSTDDGISNVSIADAVEALDKLRVRA